MFLESRVMHLICIYNIDVYLLAQLPSGDMDSLLSLKEAIVIYLDRSGGLRKLIEDCNVFKGLFIRFGSIISDLNASSSFPQWTGARARDTYSVHIRFYVTF